HINTTLIGINKNKNIINSMMYLWPFTKQQMSNYIEKFANIKSKNNDWTSKKYEETLKNYPNLQKMIEEPFLLQIILSVLPSLEVEFAIESDFQYQNDNDIIWNKLDPEIKNEHTSNIIEEKIETEIETNIINETFDIWEKYFNGDSIAKYVLRRVGDNKYQFLHKSCQEYYAAQKIIFDIISWKPTNINHININNFNNNFKYNLNNSLLIKNY
ncbi:hypothetical protein RFI_29240, partial [Reticulomyxa filosa]